MAITGLVGLPGHGKSYSALDLFIIKAVETKRKIVTNIPLNIDAIREQYPDYDYENNILDVDLAHAKEQKTAEYWESEDQWPLSALYILDELWRIWPAGLKASAVPASQLAFIKEHRHRVDDSGQEPDIVFVTQNLGDIAACVRDMVETTIICTKLTAVGAKNRFRRDYYQGAIKGFIGPKLNLIRSDQSKYKPEIYRFYQSHTKSTGGHAQIDNLGVVDATIFNGFGFKFGVGFLILLIGGAAWGLTSTVSDIKKMTTKKEPIQPKKIQPVQQIKTVVAPSEPPRSQHYRLVGTIKTPTKYIAMLQSSDGRTVRIDAFRKCKGIDEIVCEFQGQTVDAYTGHRQRETENS